MVGDGLLALVGARRSDIPTDQVIASKAFDDLIHLARTHFEMVVIDTPPTLAVSDDIGLTTSKDILEAVARGEGPQSLLVTLGYSGWSAGQLERELAANAWLTVAADPEVVFGMPVERRLPAAMRLLGIDPMQLSEDAGHA